MTQSNVKLLLMNLQWLYSIGAKVLKVIPVQTAAITALTLFSQISLLMAFLLPIKVIILLGSDSVPRYFPDFLTLLERDLLIASLAATSICAYLFHVLCDRWVVYLGLTGSEKILARASKFELFENQTGRARRAYVQYSNGLAALVFLCLGFAALCWMYPLVAWVVGAGCILTFGTAMARYRFDKSFRDEASLKVPEHIKTASDLIFLAVFLAIVADFLRGDPPGLLFGLISFILMRQWLARVTTLVAHGVGLVSRRVEVSALFFHAQTAEQTRTGKQPLLWQVVQTQREKGFSDLLAAADLHDVELASVRWIQTGFPGIACFILSIDGSDQRCSNQLLLKLFAKQRQTYASNEFTVLTMPNSEELPAPELIGVASLEGISCHIFDLPACNTIPLQERLDAIVDYRQALSIIEPTKDFLNKYHRTHPGLWFRLDNAMMERLELTANDDKTTQLIRQFNKMLPQLQTFLKNLPESLVTVEANRQNVFRDSDEHTFSIHWGRWSVEPIGSSWPIGDTEIEQLDQRYEKLITERPSLQSVSLADMKIAALAWELDRLFTKNLYADCLTVMQNLLLHTQQQEQDNRQQIAQA